MQQVKINWPNKKSTYCDVGKDWLKASLEADIQIPTGCLSGSCGACEIEINGEVIRACISKVPEQEEINVDFFSDPYW